MQKHLTMNEIYDEILRDGGMTPSKKIKQNIIKINENDTEYTLKDRLQEIEHRLYSDTIKSILIKN